MARRLNQVAGSCSFMRRRSAASSCAAPAKSRQFVRPTASPSDGTRRTGPCSASSGQFEQVDLLLVENILQALQLGGNVRRFRIGGARLQGLGDKKQDFAVGQSAERAAPGSAFLDILNMHFPQDAASARMPPPAFAAAKRFHTANYLSAALCNMGRLCQRLPDVLTENYRTGARIDSEVQPSLAGRVADQFRAGFEANLSRVRAPCRFRPTSRRRRAAMRFPCW